MKGSGRIIKVTLTLLAAAALIASCSGSAKNPESAVKKMVKAYGGEKNIPLLTSFEGKGFRKQLPPGQVATNYPFDVFQDGKNYKTKTYRIREGEVVDVQLLVVSENERFSWSRGTGVAEIPEWEVEMIGYRLPMIIDKLNAGGLELERAESEYWDGLYHVKFVEGDNMVDVGLDEETFLVMNVTIRSVAEPDFVFREEYSDYVKTDGIWFPNRFVGLYKDLIYYEFLIPVVSFGVDFPEALFTVLESDTTYAVQ
jgi:hypothetical protein